MKASDLFVKCLEEEGVEYIFAVPGEENLDLVESLRESSIQLIVTRHEQHAAFMAATYGRLTGKTGVCLATLGPGATNLLTGIAYAQLGGMPLLAITGQKGIKRNWQGNFQIVDVVDTFRPLTKWNISIIDAGTIPRHIRHAFLTAEAERPGAVHIEFPEDVAEEDVDEIPQKRVRLRRPIPDEKSIRLARELIEQAKLPVLLISGGGNRKMIGKQTKLFMEKTGIYALTTQMGKGVIPDDHPQALFSLGIHKKDYVHYALEHADLIITIGYSTIEYPPSVWNQRKDKKILHIDFNPAEPDEYYAPTLELIGDISNSLWQLHSSIIQRFDNDQLKKLQTYMEEKLHHEACEKCFPPHPHRIVQDVRQVMGHDDIICLDNGIYKLWFARMYKTYRENTILLDNALATMGAGLASAMAAKIVHPERKVMAICGDGGFMMNSQDLETAVRLGLDIVILILRDDAYGFIKWKQEGMGFPTYGMTFGNPDFVKYAEAYGATGLRHIEGGSLKKLLREAFSRKGPVIVDCPIDYAANTELGRDWWADVTAYMEGKDGN